MRQGRPRARTRRAPRGRDLGDPPLARPRPLLADARGARLPGRSLPDVPLRRREARRPRPPVRGAPGRRALGLHADRQGVHPDAVPADVLLRRRLPPDGRGEVPRPREGGGGPHSRPRPGPRGAERRVVVEGRRAAPAGRGAKRAGPRLREPRPRLLRLPHPRPGRPLRRAPPLRRHLRPLRRPRSRDASLGGGRGRRGDGPRRARRAARPGERLRPPPRPLRPRAAPLEAPRRPRADRADPDRPLLERGARPLPRHPPRPARLRARVAPHRLRAHDQGPLDDRADGRPPRRREALLLGAGTDSEGPREGVPPPRRLLGVGRHARRDNRRRGHLVDRRRARP